MKENNIWEEKNFTDHRMNLTTKDEQDKCVTTSEIEEKSKSKILNDTMQKKRKANAARLVAWRRKNREKYNQQQRERYHKNPLLHQKYHKEYRAKKPEFWQSYHTKYDKQRKACDPLYRLRKALRSRLSDAMRNQYKRGSAVRDLGCSIEQLKSFLESKFQPGMTWKNHGLYGWHIDHIKPLKTFNLLKREEFLAAFHYTNLQPLWWYENLSKSKKSLPIE